MTTEIYIDGFVKPFGREGAAFHEIKAAVNAVVGVPLFIEVQKFIVEQMIPTEGDQPHKGQQNFRGCVMKPTAGTVRPPDSQYPPPNADEIQMDFFA